MGCIPAAGGKVTQRRREVWPRRQPVRVRTCVRAYVRMCGALVDGIGRLLPSSEISVVLRSSSIPMRTRLVR